ncbi:MAG: hypothetical protein IPH34_00305 [Chitinophagaceae bacterium]|nr:hypothetical protein [Chitinophagaceae bacterium]MBP6477673.1 hypothetical protein [Chitinophagaceae bacterium]MBP7108407.1 hypothetical protein [Chitinophagaceae bacterium]MBP7315453.1 hypothetical protein [Chitinophagaceae bacterium]HQV55314.1 hypothetical protein [Chitinophagaceae bacterium]
MRKLLILLITISVGLLSEAQSAKSINFELGGPGLASFNFDTRFGPKEDGIGGRVGIGGFSLRADGDNVTVLFIPIGVNYLIGKDQRNYFELGAGVTPVIASSSFDSDNFSTTFGHVLFGYRMQPKDGGFTFRAFVSPVFGEFGFIPYFGGVSFGYKFGSGKEKK